MRQVDVPVARLPAMPQDGVAVGDVGVDVGHETVGVHVRRIAAGDVVAAHAAARPRCRRRIAVLQPQGEVQLAVGRSGQVAVEVERAVLGLGVANGAGVASLGPVGAAPVGVFGGDTQRAAVTNAKAAVGRRDIVSAVTGRIHAVAKHGLAAFALLELDVHHPGNGVRTVLGGGAVAQDLDVVNGQQWDGVEVGARIAPVARAKQVDQGRGVAALAVDQHQRLVRTQPTQRGRVDQVGAVGTGLARGVERGRQVLQRLGQIQLGTLLGRLGQRDEVHRDGRVGSRGVDAPRSDHGDRIQGRRSLCRIGLGQGLREGAECEHAGAAQHAKTQFLRKFAHGVSPGWGSIGIFVGPF